MFIMHDWQLGDKNATLTYGLVTKYFDRMSNAPLWASSDRQWHEKNLTLKIANLMSSPSIAAYSIDVTSHILEWLSQPLDSFGARIGIQENVDQGAAFASSGDIHCLSKFSSILRR